MTKAIPPKQDDNPALAKIDEAAQQLAELMQDVAGQLAAVRRQVTALTEAAAKRDKASASDGDEDLVRDALAALTELHEIRKDQQDTARDAGGVVPDRERIVDMVRAMRTGHEPRKLQ